MREYKLFVQRIGLVGITKFIINFRGLILLPVLTKNLPIEEYGIWAQVMVTLGIIPSLMSFGLPGAMARFLPSAKAKEQFQEMFYSFLSVVIVSGLFVSVLMYIFSASIATLLFDGNFVIVKILSLVIFFETIERVLFGYFRASQQIKNHSFLQFSKEFLLVVLVSIFVLQGNGLTGALVALLVKSFIVFLISISIIISQLGLKIPKFHNFKSYLEYGLPSVPGNMSTWIVNSSDRYIIGGFLGTAAVGYYSPGYTFGSMVRIFIEPLNFMLPMVLSKDYDENKLDEVRKMMCYSLKYFLMFAIPAVFGLSLLSKPLLVILSTPEIASKSYLITPFVAFSMLLFGIFSIFEKVALLVKKTKVIGTIWLFAAILNIGLNILLVPYIGIIAAAVTTLFSFMLSLAFMAYYSVRFLRFDMNFNFMLKSVISSILMSAIIVFWKPESVLSILITIIVCAVFYFAVLILLKGFDMNEFKFFRSFLKF